MRTNVSRPAAALLLAASLTAGVIGLDAAATATEPKEGTARSSAASAPTVEHQQGVVLEGTGSHDGLDVMVTVYDNSLYGSSVQIVLGDPDDGRIGHAQQSTPYVVDGRLRADVQIDGQQVTVAGIVQETGRPTKVTEPVQDAGEQIISRGTHTQLLTDVRLTLGDTVIPLEFAPAFAYELEVRRVDLYGG